MKWISLLALLFVGCYSTSGIYDSELTSTQPYVFEYQGERDQAESAVKSVLYREGWGMEVDDQGFLITRQRDLPDDEYVSLKGYYSAMTGRSMDWIRGSLSFEFADGLIFMKSRVVLDKVGEQPQSQGMPIMMKYRRLLEERGFRLAVPAGAKYSRVAD